MYGIRLGVVNGGGDPRAVAWHLPLDQGDVVNQIAIADF